MKTFDHLQLQCIHLVDSKWLVISSATNVIWPQKSHANEQWQNVVTTNGSVDGDHVISGTKDENLRISRGVQQGLQARDVIPDVIINQSFRREHLCCKKLDVT